MHLTTNPSISMADVNAHFRGKPVDDLVEALASHMKEADAKGIIRVANPVAASGLFISAMHSLAAFEMMEIHGGKNMDHAVRPFVEALWNGMAPDKPTGTKASRAKKTRRG